MCVGHANIHIFIYNVYTLTSVHIEKCIHVNVMSVCYLCRTSESIHYHSVYEFHAGSAVPVRIMTRTTED